ncbi:tryptophan-rich sensory protein [Paracoccus sp. TOH]|uniref:tryptophan-rich sensory protein n=1 Tax=Paracoccus sp. TOH TaxID=1263728 RepID=UPI0025AF2C5D|nr:tryptophan-rich sensory protein [Paracoccus sp. TOH]WJS84168.1 tryptophan-rich sensory protein [Paracoccus sp. TOH]
MPQRTLSILVLLLALAFAAAPLLSGGFNGFRPEQFPVTDAWPAQPAGWAFSIWGLIYLALIVAAAIGALRGGTGWARAAGPLGISLAVGVFWIAAANHAPLLATAMIVVMAGFAILAWQRSGPAIWQRLPLGLYAGWLTAATGVALSAVLTGYGLLPARTAAVLMLLAVLAVATVILTRPRSDWTFTPALIWALIGVIAANFDPFNPVVTGLCGAGVLLVSVLALLQSPASYRRVR